MVISHGETRERGAMLVQEKGGRDATSLAANYYYFSINHYNFKLTSFLPPLSWKFAINDVGARLQPRRRWPPRGTKRTNEERRRLLHEAHCCVLLWCIYLLRCYAFRRKWKNPEHTSAQRSVEMKNKACRNKRLLLTARPRPCSIFSITCYHTFSISTVCHSQGLSCKRVLKENTLWS